MAPATRHIGRSRAVPLSCHSRWPWQGNSSIVCDSSTTAPRCPLVDSEPGIAGRQPLLTRIEVDRDGTGVMARREAGERSVQTGCTASKCAELT